MALTQLKTDAIANDAVTSAKIPNDAIGPTELADDAVTSALIADDAITSALIADDAITSALIADDAVTQALVADEAIDEARLQISNIGSNGHVLTKQSGDTGGLTWAAPAVTFDDNNIVNDISNLALKISNLENSTRYNTNSTFVDTFQDSNGVGTFTNSTWNAGEYIDSTQTTNVNFDFANSDASDAHRHPPIIAVNDWTGNGTSSWGTGDSWANDRFLGNNNNSGNDNMALPNFAFDCAGDFTHYTHNYIVHDNYSYRGNMGGQFCVIICIKNTSATAGKNPQYSGAGALRGGPISGLNQHPGDLTTTNLDSWIFSQAYADHSGIENNITLYSWNGSDAQTQDVSGAHSSGFMARFSFSTTSGSGAANGNTAHGIKVIYDASENELEAGFLSAQSGDNYHKKMTLTNMPTSGRIYCISGFDSDTANAHTGYTSLSHNSSDESHGTIVSSAIGATGSFISNAITAPSTITKMGAVVTYKDQAGTNTLNTDLKLYLSSDNGSNWTTATLVALPDYASGVKQCAVNDLTIATAQGTALKYKVEFANQSAGSKECRVTGIALQY